MKNHFRLTMLIVAIGSFNFSNAQTEETLLLRFPTISQNAITFTYAGGRFLSFEE